MVCSEKNISWTDDQRKVIDIRDKNILVSAAAGSGKTAVLVERIIQLIKTTDIEIDRFLIVTFTNAAAAGMKNKIQKALIKDINDNNLDINNKKRLRNQLNKLNKANISTIHSFCIELLRNNFHVIGIDPNFRIGDTSECEILFNEAIDEILEDAYVNREDDFIELVESFTSNRSDNELVLLLKDIYRFILSFPQPLEWLYREIEKLNIDSEELENSLWMKVIKNNIKMLFQGGNDSVKLAMSLCQEEAGPLKYLDTLLKDTEDINRLTSILENNSFDEFIKELYSFSFPRLASIRGKAKQEIDITLLENTKELREEYKKIISSIKKIVPNRNMKLFSEDIKYMYPSMCALYKLIVKLKQTFIEKKYEKSILDFNDIEHLAIEVLKNNEVRDTYINKFKYIFIDEYQDSNQIQETLINSIKRNNNVFMVGDSKQSIYKFRLADVDLFNEKLKNYKVKSGDNEINQRVDLNHNFRSRSNILSSINCIFENIMSEKLGELNYNEEVFLNVGSDFPELYCDKVEFDIIESSIDETDEDSNKLIMNIDKDKVDELDVLDETFDAIKTSEIEAYYAVNRIKKLVKEKTYFAKEGCYKNIEYKDIVILLRAVSSWASVYEDIFFKEGIPFYSDTGTGYYDTIEVEIIINFLRLIDNIRQDIPLISIMRSPVGKFTTDDLIKIRIQSPKIAFIDALYVYKNVQDNDLSIKIDNFIKSIENYKKRSKYMKLNDLIWEILMDTNYYYFVGALPNGKVRQANLRLLTDKAYDYEKTSMTGLFNFLKYIEKLKLYNTDEGTAKILGENDNVVRLMTIHKSKGLEFQVVILAGLNKKFNMLDMNKRILKHKTYGIAPKYVNSKQRIYKETLSRLAIKDVTKIETLSEEMRVLYVALTRAVDKLILCGTVKDICSKIKKWRRGCTYYNLYTAQSYLDWVCSSLYWYKDAKPLRDIYGDDNSNIKIDKHGAKFIFNILSLDDIKYDSSLALSGKEERKKLINEFVDVINSNKYDEINNRLRYVYKYKNLIDIPTKLSVTDIKNIDNNDSQIDNVRIKVPKLIDIPMFKEKTNDFTPAEIGTITHFVMQHLDLKRQLDVKDIGLQINELIKDNLLGEKESKQVNIQNIAKFFSSDIGKRLVKSSCIKRETPFVIRKNVSEVVTNIEQERKIEEFVLIQGIIDCYFYENNEIVLIDYKTDEVSKYNIDKIKKQYMMQIVSYKEAIEKLTKLNVKECYLYLLDKGVELKVE